MMTMDENGERRALCDNVFTAIDDMPENVGITIFSPAFREQSFLARKTEYLRNCETLIGLKRGILSEVEAVERTAKEITSSEGDYNLTIIDFQQMWEKAVREAVQFYKIPADHVLVIYDDVSLPVGKLRVRPTGSAGGHNGIKNIIAHLGTQEFPRIKIGTGAPAGGGAEMIDWVIGVPSQAERKILVDSFERAVKAAADILENGCQKAMNDYN